MLAHADHVAADHVAALLAAGPRSRDDLLQALAADGHAVEPDELTRALNIDGRFAEIDGRYVHLPTLFEGTSWAVPVDVDAAVTGRLAVGPALGWWAVLDDVAVHDASGAPLGLLEFADVDDLEASDDLVAGPPGWLDGLAGRYVVLEVRDGGIRVDSVDLPPEPTTRQIQTVRDAFLAEAAAEAERPPLLEGEPPPADLRVADDTATMFRAVAVDGDAFRLASPEAIFAAAGLTNLRSVLGEHDTDWAVYETWVLRNRARWLYGLSADEAAGFATVVGAWGAFQELGADSLGADEASRRGSAAEICVHLDSLALAEAVMAESELDPRACDSLLAFVTELRHLHDGPLGRGAAWMEASALNELGDAAAAADLLDREMDASWTFEPAVLLAAGYAADRGDAAQVLRILHQLDGQQRPESADEADPVAELLAEVIQFATRPKAKAGRNDPCPCGSGRKYKACHLGRETHDLADRSVWLYEKACRFVNWERADELDDVVEVVAEYVPDHWDDLLEAPVVLDIVLQELGVFEDFLVERGPLLPVDEAMLAAQWSLVDRSLFEVIAVRPTGLGLRDTRTGDRVDLVNLTPAEGIRAGMVVVARPLPVGEVHRAFGGVLPLPPHFHEPMLAALDSDEPFAVAEVLAAVLAPPILHNSDGQLMVHHRLQWRIDPAVEVTVALSSTALQPDGDGRWRWLRPDADGPGDSVLGVVEHDAATHRLVADVNSDQRAQVIRTMIADAIPNAELLVDDRRTLDDLLEAQRDG